MSLFIRVESFGRTPRILVMRNLISTFGENADGLFQTEQVTTPWFTIFTANEDYFLQAHQTLKRNNAFDSSLLRLSSETSFEHNDHTFTFTLTPTEALVLTDSSNAEEISSQDILRPLATLSITLAHATKIFPLFDGAQFTIGSSPEDILSLPFDGVLPKHIHIRQQQDGTHIWSETGEFEIEEFQHSTEPMVLRTGTITLIPSAIDLVLQSSS